MHHIFIYFVYYIVYSLIDADWKGASDLIEKCAQLICTREWRLGGGEVQQLLTSSAKVGIS